MNLTELIETISGQGDFYLRIKCPNCHKSAIIKPKNRDIRKIISRFIKEIDNKTRNQHKIKIRDFGIFYRKRLIGRKIYNPHTGGFTKVPDKVKLAFLPSKNQREIHIGQPTI